ncbi:methyl-accepting chemotaxis protein, partial [Pseudomonas syringae pv. tagetis]
GVSAQKVETQKIATAMQKMTATTHEVYRNADQAVNTAQFASQLAQKGGQVVDSTRSLIDALPIDMNIT